MNIAQIGLLAIGILFALSLLLATAASRMGGGKGAKTPAASGDSVQELMPLASIEGHFAFMKDGSYRGYMLWPGRNQSLDTYDERVAKALIDASVIGSVDGKFSIVKLPEKINSSAQLNLVDSAIEREENAFFAAKTDEDREFHRTRLAILTEHMRNDALRESLSSQRMNWMTYIVFHFPAGREIGLADSMMDNMLRLAADVMENPPRYLDEREIRHFYQLYFTPGTVSDVAATPGSAVSPDIR